MTTPTREEMDAKLETMAVRMEGRVASLEANMKAGFAELRSDMRKLSAEVVKWIVGTALAMVAAAITVATFILNNATLKPPMAQPAPVIITLPALQAPSTSPSNASVAGKKRARETYPFSYP